MIKNALVKNRASTSIDVGPVQKIVLTTSFAEGFDFFRMGSSTSELRFCR